MVVPLEVSKLMDSHVAFVESLIVSIDIQGFSNVDHTAKDSKLILWEWTIWMVDNSDWVKLHPHSSLINWYLCSSFAPLKRVTHRQQFSSCCSTKQVTIVSDFEWVVVDVCRIKVHMKMVDF